MAGKEGDGRVGGPDGSCLEWWGRRVVGQKGQMAGWWGRRLMAGSQMQ